jgi:centrin-3
MDLFHGDLQLKNLRKVTRELGENITDEQLEAMIDEFDKDGDGAISKLEFFNIMKKTDPDE